METSVTQDLLDQWKEDLCALLNRAAQQRLPSDQIVFELEYHKYIIVESIATAVKEYRIQRKNNGTDTDKAI
jgi:hypothetical protein